MAAAAPGAARRRGSGPDDVAARHRRRDPDRRRPLGVPGHGPSGRRARHRTGRGGRRGADVRLDVGEHVPGGRRRDRARSAEVVPALPAALPRAHRRPRPAGRRRRLPGAGAHRRPAGARRPPARNRARLRAAGRPAVGQPPAAGHPRPRTARCGRSTTSPASATCPACRSSSRASSGATTRRGASRPERPPSGCRRTAGGRPTPSSPARTPCPRWSTAVGDDVEVYADGGIRSGSDVLTALALGATGGLRRPAGHLGTGRRRVLRRVARARRSGRGSGAHHDPVRPFRRPVGAAGHGDTGPLSAPRAPARGSRPVTSATRGAAAPAALHPHQRVPAAT